MGQLPVQYLHHGFAGQGREREQEIENLFEKIMTENFHNLVKEIDIQAQKVQRNPNKMNPRGPLQDTS